jgi:hypothetical protein
VRRRFLEQHLDHLQRRWRGLPDELRIVVARKRRRGRGQRIGHAADAHSLGRTAGRCAGGDRDDHDENRRAQTKIPAHHGEHSTGV